MTVRTTKRIVGKYWTHEGNCGVPGRHVHRGVNVVLPIPNEIGPLFSELYTEVQALREERQRFEDDTAEPVTMADISSKQAHAHQSFVDGCYPCDLIQRNNELRAEVENLNQAIEQTWRPEVKALREANADLRMSNDNLRSLLAQSPHGEAGRLRALLSRLYTWDMMDSPGGDGPYWRSLIEEALGGR